MASDFKDHLQICELSEDSTYLNCAHCDRSFKHVGTLMDHLKGHGPKRYSCSLCSTYRAAVPTSVKNHMRSVHHVNSYKMIPMVPARTNPDLDSFIVLPKNSIPKGVRLTATGPKSKDTFSPDQIDSIPRHSVFKVPIRCSVCDFMTKVRQNMVKHLRLHLRHPGLATNSIFFCFLFVKD